MRANKYLILGHAQHGKDTLAEILNEEIGLRFESSSIAASRLFLFDELKDKYGYQTPERCYEDRINHRKEWFDLIVEYNKDDKARLAKEILKTSNIYVGMRDIEELKECYKQNVFDMIIGVYNPRVPLEDPESFNIDIWKQSDFVIPNSGTIQDLRRRVLRLKKLFI